MQGANASGQPRRSSIGSEERTAQVPTPHLVASSGPSEDALVQAASGPGLVVRESAAAEGVSAEVFGRPVAATGAAAGTRMPSSASGDPRSSGSGSRSQLGRTSIDSAVAVL